MSHEGEKERLQKREKSERRKKAGAREVSALRNQFTGAGNG